MCNVVDANDNGNVDDDVDNETKITIAHREYAQKRRRREPAAPGLSYELPIHSMPSDQSEMLRENAGNVAGNLG